MEYQGASEVELDAMGIGHTLIVADIDPADMGTGIAEESGLGQVMKMEIGRFED